MKLTIIIPARNEEESLPRTLADLEEHVRVPHGIVVVDDYSNDGTSGVVAAFMEKYGNITLAGNDGPAGFTGAVRKGLSMVGEGAVVLVMADGCDDPRTINEMYKRILDGYDLVCGTRYAKGGGKIGGRFLQTVFSKFVNLSLFFFTGISTSDASNAFKMYRKEALDSIGIEEAGFATSLQIVVKLHKMGCKITDVPTVWKDRIAGKSNFRIIRAATAYVRWYLYALLV